MAHATSKSHLTGPRRIHSLGENKKKSKNFKSQMVAFVPLSWSFPHASMFSSFLSFSYTIWFDLSFFFFINTYLISLSRYTYFLGTFTIRKPSPILSSWVLDLWPESVWFTLNILSPISNFVMVLMLQKLQINIKILMHYFFFG